MNKRVKIEKVAYILINSKQELFKLDEVIEQAYFIDTDYYDVLKIPNVSSLSVQDLKTIEAILLKIISFKELDSLKNKVDSFVFYTEVGCIQNFRR